MRPPIDLWRLAGIGLAGIAALLAACTSVPLDRPSGPAAPPPPQRPAPAARPAVPDPAVPREPAAAAPSPAPSPSPSASPRISAAASARDYRRDAAEHLYGLNRDRIFRGRMPPMLYAIGVLQVDVDGGGQVRHLHWMRAPRHAPEVVAEIERTVRAAAPFPAPARLGRVTYTDTWLWDRSGRFQLDTLTEGQD